jgi:hypothetical protein
VSRRILLLSVLFAMCGCSEHERQRGASLEEPERPNIVLVTLDTTRADRIGSYGYGFARTPALDAIAAEGVRIEHAVAVAPLT